MTEIRTAAELYQALSDRLNDGLPWREIAVEFGCPAQELCDFFLEYRVPRKPAARASVLVAGSPAHRQKTAARKFEQWRKSQGAQHA